MDVYSDDGTNKNILFCILGGIRTHDLRIRSPARYPLRYEDIPIMLLTISFIRKLILQPLTLILVSQMFI